MQIQKEEIRQAILKSALDEFLAKGYLKASMKSIAKEAGVAVGNIYRYFKSKGELFEIVVKPAYDQLIFYINNHDHPDIVPIDRKQQKIIIDDLLEVFLHF